MQKQCFNFVFIGLFAILMTACSASPEKPAIVIEKHDSQKLPVLTEVEKTEYQRGLQLLADNKVNEAETVFKTLVQKQPYLTGGFVNLGIIEKQKGNLESAEKLFQQALDLNPNFIDGLLQKAILMREKGNFSEAESLLRRAEVIDPVNPLVNYNLGVLYEIYLQDYPSAIKHYKKYIEVSKADDVETVTRWIQLLERK